MPCSYRDSICFYKRDETRALIAQIGSSKLLKSLIVFINIIWSKEEGGGGGEGEVFKKLLMRKLMDI